MPTSTEVQSATLEKLINGWHKWTPEEFVASWSPDCTQTTLPLSIGLPTRTRAELEQFFPHLMSNLTNFQLKVHNIVHDSAHGKAVIYAVTNADTPVGPYANEHALFVWFSESGEEISRIEEMFDSAVMKDFLPKLGQYMADQGQGQGA